MVSTSHPAACGANLNEVELFGGDAGELGPPDSQTERSVAEGVPAVKRNGPIPVTRGARNT